MIENNAAKQPQDLDFSLDIPYLDFGFVDIEDVDRYFNNENVNNDYDPLHVCDYNSAKASSKNKIEGLDIIDIKFEAIQDKPLTWDDLYGPYMMEQNIKWELEQAQEQAQMKEGKSKALALELKDKKEEVTSPSGSKEKGKSIFSSLKELNLKKSMKSMKNIFEKDQVKIVIIEDNPRRMIESVPQSKEIKEVELKRSSSFKEKGLRGTKSKLLKAPSSKPLVNQKSLLSLNERSNSTALVLRKK